MLNLFESLLQALGTTVPELIFACCLGAPKKHIIQIILKLAGTANMTVLWSRVGNFLKYWFFDHFADP